MRINILAGGPTDLWPDDLWEQPGQWIGADRGAWWLYQKHVPMLLAVGDFDSLNNSELLQLTAHLTKSDIVHVKAEKDETDTELALQYAQKKIPDEIYVYGATGGRVDHLLSNIWLMANPCFESIVSKTRFVDKKNIVSYALPGENVIYKQPGMKYLGFMPLNNVINFKIKDAKYLLTLTDSVAKMWSSNEFVTNSVHISFDTGVMMITQTSD